MKPLFLRRTPLLLPLLVAFHAQGQELHNRTLRLTCDPATGQFTLASPKLPKAFRVEGRLAAPATRVRREHPRHPAFGLGQALDLEHADGSRTRLELYPELPFLLVTRTLVNAGTTPQDLPSVEPWTFRVATEAVSRTLGTGGLKELGKDPGSYLFLAAADPATRRGVVAGWLTQERASGVFFSSLEGEQLALKPRLDFGRHALAPGAKEVLETLAIAPFGDARLGLEAYGEALKAHHRIRLRAPKATYCTWYVDGHGGAGDEASTLELARFAAKELKPFGLGVIQIDDRWQDGPELDGPTRGFERARPNGPYPHGIAPVAKAVKELGLDFGLWWIPFGRNHADPAWKDRQDWFVRWSDGKPARTRGFGGTCLDLTFPPVQQHLDTLVRDFRAWGVDYFKMDGLWTGTATEQIYINDGYKDDRMGAIAPLHDPSKTQVEAYREGLKRLRREAGEGTFFSGCCLSQNMRSMTALGLVDAMRVGPDFNHDGEGIRSGPLRASRLYFLNGRVWWNDPDPSLVRARTLAGADDACSEAVSTDQARLTTSWVSLTGQFFLCSDWLPALPPERLDILKRTLAHHEGTARPVDLFDRALANTWLVTDRASGVRRDVVGVFNFYDQPLAVSHELARLGLEPGKAYHAFDFWENRLLPEVRDTFPCEVKPNACRVIAVRAVVGHPVLLSTSRHVSQGVLEVSREAWTGQALEGTSRLVGGDPCELRIAGTEGWELQGVELAEGDRQAGVVAAWTSEPGLVRVTLRSPVERDIRWRVRFRKRA